MRSLLRQQSQFVHFFLMTVILLIAVFMRVYNIEGAPPGLSLEEVSSATAAYQNLTSGQFKWFYDSASGHEGLYINMQTISMALFGINTFAIKFPSIVLGLLSILGLYFLSREFFPSKPRIALIAAYLAAISFWAVNFSRLGFRAIAMLPVLCFTLYFFFRGVRTRKLHNYIFAGLICGLGFHTYPAFYVMPFLFTVIIFLFLLIDKRFLRLYAKGLFSFVLFAMFVASPLFIANNAYSDYLSTHTNNIVALSPQSLVQTIGPSLAKYNMYSDANFHHNFPPYPILEPLTGLAFLSGLVLISVLFFRTLRLRFTQRVRNRNLVISGLLLAWFVGFLIPEFLTNDTSSNTLQSLGTMPVVFLLAAYGLNAFIEQREGHSHKTSILQKISRVTSRGVLIVFFCYLGAFGFMKYHVNWAYHPQTARDFNADLKEMARSISEHPTQQTYVIAIPKERASIQIYNTSNSKLIFINQEQAQSFQFEKNAKIYITRSSQPAQQLLRQNTSIQEMYTTLKTTSGDGLYTIVTTK